MKKRPKLSLSAGKDADKKQALDFETGVPAEPEIPPAETEKPPARAAAPSPEIRTKPPISTGRNKAGAFEAILLGITACLAVSPWSIPP